MKNRYYLILACALFLNTIPVLAADISVENQWIREAPPGAKALGGFMTLNNHSDKDRYLVAASSPAFAKIELHRTEMVNGLAKMIHQPQVIVPSHGQTLFKPMDYHLMMMKPKQQLTDGDQVPVTLSFKNGDSEQTTFVVKKMAMTGQSMHHMKMH